jgi:phenylacetate-CoA ligase
MDIWNRHFECMDRVELRKVQSERLLETVERVLLEMSEIKPHYQLIVDRVNNLDTLELKVEVDEAFFLDKISQLESLRKKIQENLESSLGLGIKVTLVEPKMIERSEGKSKRVIDKRKF